MLFDESSQHNKKFVVYSSIVLEKIFKKITMFSLAVAEKSDSTALMFRQKYSDLLETQEPSLRQWVNRLIEHVDSRYIIVAYHHFLSLIESGCSPDDAFERVVGDVY